MALHPPLKKKVQNVGLIAKKKIALHELDYIKKIIKYLHQQKKTVLLDANIEFLISKKTGYSRPELMEKTDLVIVLGGDGTILKTAGCTGKKQVLVLGINLGNLGFLTEISPPEIKSSLAAIFKGGYTIDKRALLRVTHYQKNKKINTFLAMNDAVINQGLFARLIELGIEVDEKKAVSFKADGMIIATPTGSTAHSLSAGGPIVHPALNALVLTPICPATLALRPIVIPNDRQVKITVVTERHNSYNIGLTIDGQITVPLEYGDLIKVRKSKRQFNLVRLEPRSYYTLLREKLGWGEHRRD